MTRITLFLFFWLLAIAPIYSRINIATLPEKDAPPVSADYEVSISGNGTEWQKVPVLHCDVDMHKVSKASFAEFDTDSPVTVRVRNLRPDGAFGSIDRVAVRPTQLGIIPKKIDERTVEFTLPSPKYVSVEFGNDLHHNLHVFANLLLTEHYAGDGQQTINWAGEAAHDVFVKDAKVIYFGPGMHRPKDLPSSEIKIPSNTTVYIAPGAVIKARLIVDHAENVRIISRGVIDHPLRGLEITFSKNVYVDGLTILNPMHYSVFGGQSEYITLKNIKAFSSRGWSDGIDLMCCKHVKIENVFLRNSDDNLAFYNHRWWYWGGTEDIEVSKAVLWCDFAHPVNIGSHGDDRSVTGEVLKNVKIHDTDILYHNGDGALTISCGDKNHISDITFDNIRIDNIKRGRVFDFKVVFGAKYNRAPGNSVSNVTLSNINLFGNTELLPSRIMDYDEARKVNNIKLSNVCVIGQKMRMSDVERSMQVTSSQPF